MDTGKNNIDTSIFFSHKMQNNKSVSFKYLRC